MSQYFKKIFTIGSIFIISPILSQEITIDRITQEIPDGCSNEVVDFLESENETDDDIDFIITDTLLATCTRFDKPKKSLRLIKSVRERLIGLELDKNQTDDRTDWMYALYSYFWFEIYFANGLINESTEIHNQNTEFYSQLKRDEVIPSEIQIYASMLYYYAYDEVGGDKSYIYKTLRFIESIIPLSTKPENPEMNLNLASYLVDIRIDLLSLGTEINDMELIAASLSVFSDEYLSNINESKVSYFEFADVFKERFKNELQQENYVTDDILKKWGLILEIDLNDHNLLPLSTAYSILARSDAKFPKKDKVFKNLVKYYLETTKKDSYDQLYNLDSLIGSGTFLQIGRSDQPLVFSEACEMILGSKYEKKLAFINNPRNPMDTLRNYHIQSIYAGCDPSIENFLVMIRSFEEFVGNNYESIRALDYSFSDSWADNDFDIEDPMIEILDHIYLRLLVSITFLSTDPKLEHREEIKTASNLFINLSKTFTTREIEDTAGLAVISWMNYLNAITSEVGISLDPMMKKIRFSEKLFEDLDDLNIDELALFANIYSAYVLSEIGSHQLRDDNSAYEALSKNVDLDEESEWMKEYEELLIYHIDKASYLLDLLIPKLFQSEDLLLSPISSGNKVLAKDLISIITAMQTTKYNYFDSDDTQDFVSLLKEMETFSEKIASYSYLFRDDQISLTLYKNKLLQEFEDKEIKKLLSQYFDTQSEINYLNELRIVTKKGSSSSALSFREVEARGELANYRELIAKNISSKDMESINDYYNYDPDYLKNELDDNEALIVFFNSDNSSIPMIRIAYTNEMTIVDSITNPLTGLTFRSNREVPELLQKLKLPSSSNLYPVIEYNYLDDAYRSLMGDLVESNFYKGLRQRIKDPSYEPIRVNKLYIVADGLINKLPIHALFNLQEEKFMVEDFDIQYLPNEQSFTFLKDKIIDPENETFVGIGNPSLDGKSLRTQFNELFTRGYADNKKLNELSALPSTAIELENISKKFKNSRLFLGDSATESNIRNDVLMDASIISFATHAVENITDETYEVGLVLTPPDVPSNDNDGLLTRSEISSLSLDNSTIILSACNTAGGLYEGDKNYNGLAAGFFEAGANTLVLSMWDLETNSATEMSTLAFEIATENNIPLGEAYNQAMREFINNPKYKQYSHPYYWAGFQMIGK